MTRTRVLSIDLALVVILAVAPLAQAAPADKADKDYFAVLIDGKKIGFSEHSQSESASEVTTTEKMDFTLQRGPTKLRLQHTQTTIETPDGKPIGFKTVMDMGIMAQATEGRIEGGKLKLKITAAGQSQEKTQDWPEGALLARGLELLGRAKGLKEGTTYTARVFDTSMLMASDVTSTVGPKEKIDLLGRVVLLTKVTSVLKAATGEITSVGYVDDQHQMQRMSTSMMGMKMEVIACSEAYARSPNDEIDFFSKQILRSPTSLASLKDAQAVTYVLEPQPEAKLSVMEGDNQKVRTLEGGRLEVRVKLARAVPGGKMPYDGKDEHLLEATKPARFLESDRKEVIELARKATQGTTDPADAVKKIRDFVRKHVNKKNLSVGYASAAEVAVAREGDCSEHAVLVAAMCRAVGIPAEVVMGVAYVPAWGQEKDIFMPHAWAQAHVNGTWVFLDAALPTCNAARIALASGDGDLDAFFDLVKTLGCFKIASATIE